jgi:hypothetical protein
MVQIVENAGKWKILWGAFAARGIKSQSNASGNSWKEHLVPHSVDWFPNEPNNVGT